MKVIDIYNFLDIIAPFASKESWDNCGLIVGDFNCYVKKICVALDFTRRAVDFAVSNNCDLLITHHPAIFKAVKSVTADSPVFDAVKNGVNIICSHTCLDMADGGVNDILCELLDLENVEKIYSSDENSPIMRMGYSNFENAVDFAKFVSARLGGNARLADCGKKVYKVGVCSGSGCSLMSDIIKSGCDTFVTGDASHHDFIDACENGINLVAAGHFETENPVVDVLVGKLKEKFCGLDVIKVTQKSPCDVINYGT